MGTKLSAVALKSKIKTCTKCGVSKPATTEFFYAQKTCRGGLATSCKKCRIAYSTEHQRAHKEAHAITMASYYQRNKEMRLAYNKKYQQTHPDKVAQSNKRNHKAHPETRAAIEERRRARKKNIEGSYTGADVLAQRIRQQEKCFWCKEKLVKAQVDHVVPLALGGSNKAENIVIACLSCNRTKHAQHPMDYAGIMF
jgi:5-methylcytosine-specific restriction endonuclease McrA